MGSGWESAANWIETTGKLMKNVGNLWKPVKTNIYMRYKNTFS